MFRAALLSTYLLDSTIKSYALGMLYVKEEARIWHPTFWWFGILVVSIAAPGQFPDSLPYKFRAHRSSVETGRSCYTGCA